MKRSVSAVGLTVNGVRHELAVEPRNVRSSDEARYAGAVLAVLWNSFLIEILLNSAAYSRHDVLRCVVTLCAVLAAAVTMVAMSVFARWRLIRH